MNTNNSLAMLTEKPTAVVIIGAPGAGKTTQLAHLSSAAPDVVAIETSAILKMDSRIYTEYMLQARNAPDADVISLVTPHLRSKLVSADGKLKSCFLNGYPRNHVQALVCVPFLLSLGYTIDRIIALYMTGLPLKAVLARIALRGREDDGKIASRYQEFIDTKPGLLCGLQNTLGRSVVEIDARQDEIEVYSDIVSSLSGVFDGASATQAAAAGL